MVDFTGSTQVDLAKKVRDGVATHGDVLATEFQSAGRGRLDRTFVAPAHSALLFSFYVEPKDGEWGWLPLLAGQSVCAAISKVLALSQGDGPKLKWPNDILLNDKKVAGLLSERTETIRGAGVVIGIGMNISTAQEELPVSHATSLSIEGYLNTDRNELLVEILESFSDYLRRWEDHDPALLIDYLNVSATIGRVVEIELPGGTKVTSTASSIDSTGALVLADGRHITVGDVVHVSAT